MSQTKPQSIFKFNASNMNIRFKYRVPIGRRMPLPEEWAAKIERAKSIIYAQTEADPAHFYSLMEAAPLDPETVDAMLTICGCLAIAGRDLIEMDYIKANAAYGGGKRNRHKDEAVEIYTKERPGSRSDNQAHERVREKLAAKYQDPPTVRTICIWCK